MGDGRLSASSQALLLGDWQKARGARVDSGDEGENLENAQNQLIGLRLSDSVVSRP